MFRKLIGGLTSTAVIGGLVTAGAVAASVATASPALAASVNIGTVEAQMAGHTGKSGQVSNADNCIRFDPPAPPAPAVETTWVTNPTEAATSHGSSTGSCPTDLSRFVQSAVGITPVAGPTTVNTGTSFLLGTMRHYNNPINVAESSNNPPRPAKFVGNLNVKLQSTTFTFPYELYETPNSCSGKVDDEQVNCSDDILEFTSTPTGELTITNGGVDYAFSLVSSGFGASIVDPQDPTKRICPATPEPPTKTKFITTEGTTTTACLYGKLAQKRSIKLVKKVEWNPDVNGPTSIPDFKFTSTSDLVGSPWKTEPGNLQPANTNGATASYGPKDFRAGVETVTITEGADPANWTFKDVQCVDGTDAAVTGVSYDGRTVTLANVPDATSSDAVPITCTFTNSYTPALRPGINVVKAADPAGPVRSGTPVKYTYTVTNTGNTSLSSVTVTDNKCSPVTYKSGDTNSDNKLQTTETWIYECTTTLANTTTNIATATGTPPVGPPVTDTDTVTVTVIKPGIKVVKKADATEVHSGDLVTYTYTVTNTGDTPLEKVSVTDDKCSPVTYKSGDTNSDNKLQTTETWLYECSTALTNTTTNIVTATGEDKLGKKVTDDDTVTVTVLKAWLTLVKQVEGKADADEWTLTAEALDHPKAPMVENLGGSGTSTEVWSQVEYTLKEEGPGNYSPMDWVCLPDKAESPTTTQVEGQLNEGDKITLKTGARVTCTIVNVRDLAELKLVKQVEGKNKPNDWTLSATAGAPDTELNFSNKGGEGDFQTVYAGTQYQLKEEGPGGYSPSDWQCELAPQDVEPGQVEEIDLKGDKITLQKGQRVTCTIINTRDLGSLTITKEFNPQASGYTGTFDINYTCVDGADKVKEGTVKLAAGKSETISGLPTGTVCTVTEPTLPANPSGWTFNSPTFSPANGQVTVTTKDQTVSVTVINSVAQVSPVVVKKICPIDVTLKKPQPKKVGNKILTKKIKTKKSSCVLLKPVVLCRPLASSAAGETAFCDTKVTKKGRITVKTKGYERVRVTVIVRTKPKPGFEDRWKPNNWRKSWILR